MKIIFLYNLKSGNKLYSKKEFKSAINKILNKESVEKFETHFIEINDNDENIDEFISSTNNIKAIVIAGGDGTISRNIRHVINNNLLLGIIPTGTFNNFAKDNKIPLDFESALKVIFNFNTVKIDAAKVNEKFFVNNSSIGLYTQTVKIRERTKREYKLNKFSAMFLAMIRIFYLFPMIYVEVKANGKIFNKKTPFVFVGNNKYQFDLLSLGARKNLNNGYLYVNYSKCEYRFCLFKIGIKALLSKLSNEKDFLSEKTESFTIKSKKRNIHIAADGEIFKMETPLNYQIIPNAIKLITPRK